MWLDIGGYDEHMLSAGGENLEQSLRVCLCGGEVMVASGEPQVVRLRQSSKPETGHNLTLQSGDVAVSRARAVHAWFGDFAQKLDHFPIFSDRAKLETTSVLPWYGNISNVLAVKERLQCHPFAWFLRRFRAFYENAGLIPEEVFMLREERSMNCLGLEAPGSARLMPCEPATNHRLYWHPSNRHRRGAGLSCCSGLRVWNTDQCLENATSKQFKTGVCDVMGARGEHQHWVLTESGMLRQRDLCVAIDVAGSFVLKPCAALRGKAVRWSRIRVEVPLEMRLYRRVLNEQPELFVDLT